MMVQKNIIMNWPVVYTEKVRRHGSLDVAAYCHIMLLAVFPDR